MAASSAESNLAAAVGAIRSLVEDKGEDGEDSKKRPDLSSCDTADMLDTVLRERLPSPSQDGNPEDVRWEFVEASMAALDRLKAALAEAEASEGQKGAMLSVKAESAVSSLVQATIALGLLPSLLPGVGLSPQKRSKWARVCMEGRQDEDESGARVIERKHSRLVAVTRFLLDLAASSPRLGNIVLSKHLGDVLAALVQLGHAPLMKPKKEADAAAAMSDDKFVMTPEKYEALRKEQAYFGGQLIRILDKVFQPTAVKYLLLLQTGGEAGSPHRKWVQRVCGQLLSGRLTKEGGVLNVMRAVVDASGSEADYEARKFEVVAEVIASPPATTYQDVEEYYSVVCPQILALLKVDSSTSSDDAKQLGLMSVACVRAVMERSPVHGRYIALISLI